MDLTCFDGSIYYGDFLHGLLDTCVIWPGMDDNACILELFSRLSSNVTYWADRSDEVMAIYEAAYYDYAVEEDRRRLIDLIDAAFPGPLAHEKAIRQAEEKAKNEAIRRAACEKEKAARKIARTLAREVFRQAEEEAERQAEEAELRAIARANRKAERKAQRQAEKAALKAIAKANRKAERQANREAEREAEIQRLELPMLQVNEVSYAPDSTPVLAPTEALIQEVSDKEQVVVMATEETEDLEPVEEILASAPSMWIAATPTAEETFYEREQVLLPCSMAHVLPPLPALDTSLDVDFNTFESQPPTESPASVMPRRKTFLSPFRGLALRQSLGNWARASKPSKTVVAVRDTEKEAIEKASNIEVYGREQVVSTCSIEKSVVTMDTVVIVEAIVEPMEPMKKPFTKAIERPARPCFSAWIFYTTSWILAIFLHGMSQSFALLLTNGKRPIEAIYKGRPKVKIKAAVLLQG